MTRIFFAVQIVVGLATSLWAQNNRLPTPTDLAGLREVSDVRISPDGEQVAFVVTSASEDQEARNSDIWIVPSNGEEPARPFAMSDFSDDTPRWSPDREYLAFLSNRGRDRKRQIYLLRTDGGEAEKITRMPQGVKSFKWSNDGSMIAFTSEGLWVVDLATHNKKRLSTSTMNILDFDWAPNGVELAINDDNKLVIVSLKTAEVSRTLCEKVSKPWSRRKIFDWSPDGSTILFAELSPPESSPAGIGFWMSNVPASGGEALPLLKEYSGTITSAIWGAGSNEVFAQSFEGTASKILKIDVKTESIEVIIDEIFQEKSFDISADGERIAYLASSNAEPTGVWVYSKKTGRQRLTHFNPQFRSLKLGDVREVTWKNEEDDQMLYGVLVTPVGYRPGKRYPMIVQIHGGPHFAWWRGWLGDWHDWAQLLAANGYVVFLPNPRGSTGQGLRFSLANVNDIGDGPLRDILAGVDYLISEGIADPQRLGVGGWSYGGYLTAWTITQTNRFKAAVVGAGISNVTKRSKMLLKEYYGNIPVRQRYKNLSKVSPNDHLHNVMTPTLILHGEEDQKINKSQAEEIHSGLREMGIDTELVIYSGEGHRIKNNDNQRDMLERILAWFEKYVK